MWICTSWPNSTPKCRVRDELPIIKALAELSIEQEFGIKSSTTVWREHLYELAGFKDVLGSSLVNHIVEGYSVFPELS